MQELSLEGAERLFFWSNALYVLGALLTLACAVLLIRARRTSTPTAWWPVLNSNLVLAPAAICLLGTVSAICFSAFVLNRERASLDSYKLQVALELARLRSTAEADSRVAQHPALLESALGAPESAPAASESTRQLDLGSGVAESLRGFQGMRAVVESAPSDAEAAEFADRLLLLLIANGIDARQGTDWTVLHQLVGQPGIHLRYKDPEKSHDFAAALATLLRGHGLQVDVAPSWDLAARLDKSLEKRLRDSPKGDQLLISVGPKS